MMRDFVASERHIRIISDSVAHLGLGVPKPGVAGSSPAGGGCFFLLARHTVCCKFVREFVVSRHTVCCEDVEEFVVSDAYGFTAG
jgi:hypothetical protein